MRIKTFEAPTMQEALTLARQELGDEAVVLNTKHVKAGGILGLRGQNKVELMAAIDDCDPISGNQSYSTPAVDVQSIMAAPVVAAVPAAMATPVAVAEPVVAPKPSPASFASHYAGASAACVVEKETDPEVKMLRTELKELTSIVQSIMSMQPKSSSQIIAPAKLDKPLLIRLGVDEDLARGLLSECLAEDDPAKLASMLTAKIQAFAVPPTIDTREVIALVGPTGVGKTTTLAKLAAKFSLEQGKKVAMVTADTYRIGAVEQLRTYARIMGVPLEIALSPEEVAAGVEKHKDKDVVLIDTVGRSQRSNDHLSELKSFVDAAKPTQTHLVVAASLSNDVQREVVEKFTILSPTRLVITKLDESINHGCLVNLPLRTGLGISCTTAGQNVPQDIDFAEAGKIARSLMEVA